MNKAKTRKTHQDFDGKDMLDCLKDPFQCFHWSGTDQNKV